MKKANDSNTNDVIIEIDDFVPPTPSAASDLQFDHPPPLLQASGRTTTTYCKVSPQPTARPHHNFVGEC